jgi:carboxypeptidase Taq
MTGPYQEFLSKVRLIQHLSGAAALLGWDQEVCLPPAGTASRATHLAALATVIHEKMCDARLGELIEELAGRALDPVAAADLREFKRERDRAVRLPSSLVADFAAATALAHADWVIARDRDDWRLFAPHLTRLVELSRRKAEAIGYAQEPYDALLDEFEPGARAGELATLFSSLREAIVDLLSRVEARSEPTAPAFAGDVPVARQDAFGREVLAAVGYDFAAGRLDVSAHPFTEAIGAGDVRITSRYDTRDIFSGLYACLHEGGHALYEQGLPAERRDQPSGQAASLGIHESQSRLWENHVGRSHEFAAWVLPRLREAFGGPFLHGDSHDLYRAANVVRRSLIRIEADEVTYNLHIILRLDIERALLRGDLAAADVAAVWREKMRADLGIEPRTDTEGALQDIHWSMGALGYFPTYTLGNLYAAQMWKTLQRDLPGAEAGLARGEFAPVLGWLREKIHVRGSLFRADDLCCEVTGSSLRVEPYLDYLNAKFGELYGASAARGDRTGSP